ncbi:GNAT family N-acetyltransferase [Thalassobacillus pellis]|uniref:GNAT family N-acetyltransferase n=1 Tax=Thalassobacillus pellis TaxID=748008 RepID=UPI003B8374BE
MDHTIKELKREEEVRQAFPVLKQLRGHLDEEAFVELVFEAKERDMYKLYALYKKDTIVAVTGFKPMITLYYGRFVWVCDLVTDEVWRSQGYGKKLLNFVEFWAIKNNFESVALSSGLQRTEAHSFYETKMDYDKASYVFKKNLK